MFGFRVQTRGLCDIYLYRVSEWWNYNCGWSWIVEDDGAWVNWVGRVFYRDRDVEWVDVLIFISDGASCPIIWVSCHCLSYCCRGLNHRGGNFTIFNSDFSDPIRLWCSTSRDRFKPDGEYEPTWDHWVTLEQQVKVYILGRCVRLTSFHVIHDLGIIESCTFN